MSLWDKLNTELNRAGRAAQGAFDEGRLRIEIFRVRQLADKSAQALGYAVHRARAKGEELEPATWDRLEATLKEHEAEATRLEQELTAASEPRAPEPAPAPPADGAAPQAAPPVEPPPAD